ncbi:probable serine/threonine-protein kinase tsuA [Drosophila tropicalis]|uniref:probable serine/threonine-protein kinase tsuA n=1 Tax=Drosophila tropicalis TaxID=46794 RepID=UPI0035ABDC46
MTKIIIIFVLLWSISDFGLYAKCEALPFEYLDDDDFNNYDLDTVQSQAKYDAHLLSQQMLSDAELLKQRADSESADTARRSSRAEGDQGEGRTAPAAAAVAGSTEEDLEPHSRAAACLTNGHKYTHGQKVPRLDACEVCLCMDGEIFCWWEKCDKANVNKMKSSGAAAAAARAEAAGPDQDKRNGKGYGDGNGDGDGEGDYSDPYRYESTTRESTKLHKMATGRARKVGKRHKHYKNQKNFNDYEVYHSRKQKLLGDYENYKKLPKQQQQQQQLQQKQKPKSDETETETGNKQQQHSQIQQQQQQEQQHQKLTTSMPVNPAKETHYQESTPHPHTHPHAHAHGQPHPHTVHSSSKILNFPENLPALLYYDYKTEEHEHHQHQHHQQHLMHERQRLQQQHEEAEARQKAAMAAATAAVDKSLDEAETDNDSDILPEPPTKGPPVTPATSSTMPTLFTTRSNEMATTLAATNVQHEKMMEQDDDAFHRWLTSTELNVENTNTLDVSLEQEKTSASTIIDDVAAASAAAVVNRSDSSNTNTNSNNNNNNNVADAVFFRSSYNDYSSEFNGSVVNIDITLTAVDVHPHGHTKTETHQQTDLIANGNSNINSTAASASTTTMATGTGTTIEPEAVSIHSNSNHKQQQPEQEEHPHLSTFIPLFKPTTIIATTSEATAATPLAPGRMCNVLGKLYRIGDILPQDTGNCLQCICTDAVTPDEMPSVTCSPHNCPPLVLPDLFDATGY